jgi:hypothetical protein
MQTMTDERLDRLVRQLLSERADDVAADAMHADAMAERIAVRLRPSLIGRRWVLLAAAALLVALAAGAVAVGSGLLRLVLLPEPVPTVEPRPFAGVMTSTGAMAVARLDPTAVALLDGRVLVAGGSASSDGSDRPIQSAEIWDLATGRFMPVGSPTWPRSPRTAVLLEDGRVLFVGEQAVEIFDPATNSFTTAGALLSRPPGEERGHAAIRLPDGLVLVTGGYSLAMNPTAEVDIVDPATGEFTALPPLARPTSGHEMAVLPDGRVLLFGANIGCCEEPRVEIYDPATGRSELAGQWPGNPTCTCPDRMVLLEDGRLLILQEVMPQRYQPLPANAYETFMWDPVTDTAVAGPPIVRQDDTNVVGIRHLLPLTDGRLIVVGSEGSTNPAIDWVGVLDPMSGSLERLASPTGVQTTVVKLPNGGVLFLGGTAVCRPPEVGPSDCVGEPTNSADLLH